MSPTDPVLAHLISRLEADVRFLADQGHISQADSQTVLGVFSRAGSGSVASLAANFGGVSLGVRDAPGMPAPYGAPPAPAAYSPPPAPPASYSAPPAPYSPNAPPAPYSPAPTPYNANSQGSFNTPAPAFPGGPPAPAYGTPSPAPSSALKRPVPPPPPVSSEPQCKALWDYNLDGKLGGDLTFRSGDVITLVKEDNPDWWTGRLNGREGMFPSNHVEKLPPSAPGYNPSYGYDEKQQQYAPPAGAPAAYQQGPAQPATEEEKKKGKFGKYGSMMAGSAAGGLGFGAGAAVGSGLINAIF